MRWLVLLLLFLPSIAWGQGVPALGVVVGTCGTPPNTYSAGQNKPITIDTTGRNCDATTATIIPPTPSARHFPGCTVGTGSAQCLAASTAQSFLQIQNTSTGNAIACAFGVSAALNSSTSVQLSAGQGASWGIITNGVPSGALNCIASGSSTPLLVEWQ